MRRWRATEPAPARHRATARRVGLIGLTLGVFFLAGQARAQQVSTDGLWSGSVALESDARPRGVTLSDGEPAWRASLVFDDDEGWFAGTSAATVRFRPGSTQVELSAFAGLVGMPGSAGSRTVLGEGVGWEAGIVGVVIAGDSQRNHVEAFAGLNAERWNLRASASPDYYGGGERTLYLELNAHQPIDDRWRLMAHAGVLLSASPARHAPPADVRLATALTLGQMELQVGWAGSTRRAASAYIDAPRRGAWLAHAAWYF